jgi:hypothetical protein
MKLLKMINLNGDGNYAIKIALHVLEEEMIMIINAILVKLVYISIVIKLREMVFPVLAMIIASITDFI